MAEQRSQSGWLGFELDDHVKVVRFLVASKIVQFSETSIPAVEPTQSDTGQFFPGAKEAGA